MNIENIHRILNRNLSFLIFIFYGWLHREQCTISKKYQHRSWRSFLYTNIHAVRKLPTPYFSCSSVSKPKGFFRSPHTHKQEKIHRVCWPHINVAHKIPETTTTNILPHFRSMFVYFVWLLTFTFILALALYVPH